MWMTEKETALIKSHVRPSFSVLEWGSGESTIELAKIAFHVTSIEHDEEWASKPVPANVVMLYKPPFSKHDPEKDGDGNLSKFLSYVVNPVKIGLKYDIILIDGRCRVACAAMCPFISFESTKVFIHDYDFSSPCRQEYIGALRYLDFIQREDSLAMFKPKKELLCDFRI